MRTTALAATLALGACLSAPTGIDPADLDAAGTTWPPPGADIIALGSGDVDGDGKGDVVVADAGNARIHLLRGGGDLDPTRATVTTSAANAPLAGLRPPAAITVATVAGARLIVVLDNPTQGPRLSVFDMTLQATGTAMLSVAAPSTTATVTVTQSSFGMDMDSVFATVPDGVAFIEGSRLDDLSPQVMLVPAPAGTPFVAVLAATGYVPLGDPPIPKVAVSELALSQRADAMSGNFTWSTIRPTATTTDWTAQVVAEVTGDQFPDIVGFAPEGSKNDALLCILDINAGAALPCFQTPFTHDTATLAVGKVVDGEQTDVILVHTPPTAGQASVFIARNFRVMGGNAVADSASPPFDINLTSPRHAVLQLDDGPEEVVLMGTDGVVVCARNGTPRLVPCAQ